jgi:hypothetical protein
MTSAQTRVAVMINVLGPSWCWLKSETQRLASALVSSSHGATRSCIATPRRLGISASTA